MAYKTDGVNDKGMARKGEEFSSHSARWLLRRAREAQWTRKAVVFGGTAAMKRGEGCACGDGKGSLGRQAKRGGTRKER